MHCTNVQMQASASRHRPICTHHPTIYIALAMSFQGQPAVKTKGCGTALLTAVKRAWYCIEETGREQLPAGRVREQARTPASAPLVAHGLSGLPRLHFCKAQQPYVVAAGDVLPP
jgi:hypothetical protein